MDVKLPQDGDLLSVAQKVLGDEGGIHRLIRDVKGKAAEAQRQIKVAESDLERAKNRLTIVRTEARSWQEFSGILEALAQTWGVDKMAVLPTRERTQESPDSEPAAQHIDPETKERMDEGKLCMFRFQKGKNWCPTKLTKKIRDAGGQYCAKHQRIVYGKDR